MAGSSLAGGALLDNGALWQQAAEQTLWQSMEQELSDRVAMLENLIRRTNDMPPRDMALQRDRQQAIMRAQQEEDRARGVQTFATHGWIGPFFPDGQSHRASEFSQVGAVVPGVSINEAAQDRSAGVTPVQAVERDLFFDPIKAEHQAVMDRQQKARVMAYRYDHPQLMRLAGLNPPEKRPAIRPGVAYDYGPPWRRGGGSAGSSYYEPLYYGAI
mmetsp:Transcript_60243/g.143589  ORF Transcript_60243/g.143589 Transcript_60243/m.143589 type:complete len:215 (+) Transcript_60243:84-728(+)